MNDAQPVKRGRGRPRKVCAPIEAFSDEQLRAAMAAADQIDRARTMDRLIAEQEAAGLHPAAFRMARKLARQGASEAKAFYEALGRYLRAAGLLEPSVGPPTLKPSKLPGNGRDGG